MRVVLSFPKEYPIVAIGLLLKPLYNLCKKYQKDWLYPL